MCINDHLHTYLYINHDLSLVDDLKILQIPFWASRHDLDKAYRNLSRKYHPDKCQDVHANQLFQLIKNSYERVLKFKNVQQVYQKGMTEPTSLSIKEMYIIATSLYKLFSNE